MKCPLSKHLSNRFLEKLPKLIYNPKMFWILVGVVTFFYFYYKWKLAFFRNQNIKGPTPVPFFGTSHKLLSKPMFEYDYDNHKIYGDLYTDNSILGKTMLATSRPDMIRQVLIKDFPTFIDRSVLPLMPTYLRKALALIEPSQWKRIRTIVTPIFTSGKLKRIYRGLDKPINQSIENYEQLIAKNGQVDVKEMNKFFAVDVIAKVVFACEFNSFKQQDDEFMQQVMALGKPSKFGFFLTNIFPIWFLKAAGISVSNEKPKNFFVHRATELIEYRRQNPELNFDDFLQLLMEVETENEDNPEWKRINREEIIGQALVFFLAGMETISSALTNTLYELALHPEWQDKLYEDIIKSHPEEKFDYEDLNKCKLLDQVLKEVLRRHSTLARIFRTASKDYEFSNGIRIKKGHTVMIPVHTLHHNPEVFPDPFKFDPLRFDDDHQYETGLYLPFGDGPRNCVGMRFALIEVKYYLINFLKNFRVFRVSTTDVPPKYRKKSALTTYDHLRLGVERRQ